MAIAEIRSATTVTQGTAHSPPELAPRPTPSSSQLPPLTVGQEVEAEVVDELQNGLVLVNIGGALLTAEATETLPTGQAFSARVEQLQPQVVLKLLVETSEEGNASIGPQVQTEAAKLLRAAIPHNATVAESLAALTQELSAFVEQAPLEPLPSSLIKLQDFIKALLPEQTPPSAAQIAAFIRDSGLQYETKLLHAAENNPQVLSRVVEEDLKGLVLQALQDFSTTQPSRLGAALAQHLEHIEGQQAVNLLARAQGEPYQLQMPFFTGQSLTTAYLSIETDGSGAGEKGKKGNGETEEGYNILFALDLEHFGQTRIDARISAMSLWAAFYVDQPESVTLLQQELPEFRATLQSLGYAEVLLVAKPLTQLTPEKQQKFATLTVGVPPSVHLLDVKA